MPKPEWIVNPNTSENQWGKIAEILGDYYSALLDRGIPHDLASSIVSSYAAALNQSMAILTIEAAQKSQGGKR